MSKFKSTIMTVCTLSLLSAACTKLENQLPFQGRTKTNKVSNNPNTNTMFGDDKIQFQAISQSLITGPTLENEMLSINSDKAIDLLNTLPKTSKSAANINFETNQEESLLVGIPLGLIGQQSIFGGVITKVSDKKSEALGGLKLTDLPGIHVRPLYNQIDENTKFLTLVGCMSDCDEAAPQEAIMNFPIKSLNMAQGLAIVDLSVIGQELNLIGMMDPQGEYTKLKTVSSKTTKVEYDFSTLVFDVTTRLIPVTADVKDPAAPVTEFTVRWYLKLSSGFNPAFTPRTPTEGIGYFQTERSKQDKITRFSMTQNGSMVKYYIKNVPKKYQPIFAGAFDKWNLEFKNIINRDLLAYEFIQEGDPRLNEIVAGDVRYNVLEWDLDNAASYGGLGPSIANQYTGEIFSANVLIQGPKIIEMYTQWFEASAKSKELKLNGLAQEAHEVMSAFNAKVRSELAEMKKVQFKLKLGNKLEMNIRSQNTELEDPIAKGHFELVPDGMTFDKYIAGYFEEMLDHELGHNLGLRHNFKGNLGAFESRTTGSVSRSIMEYLGRGFRYLNAIGAYDRMAISYGYMGVAPTRLNWFCTDEDQALDAKSLALKSPECSKSDATSDPFSFWEGRLARSIDLLLETKSNEAPLWKITEMATEVSDAITGIAAYAVSVEKTSATWTNFFGKGDRPDDKSEVKDYVLQSFKKQLCDPELKTIIGMKSPEAQKIALSNLEDLRKVVVTKTTEFSLFKPEELNCL